MIAPLFPRRQPRAAYVTLEEALPLGLPRHRGRRGRVGARAAAVANPLDVDVLLYDGEELLGAKQNRILNVTVLVAARERDAHSRLVRRAGTLARAQRRLRAPPRTPPIPELRRRKAERLLAAPLERGVAQAAVWDAVRAKAGRLGVALADRRAGRHLRRARATTSPRCGRRSRSSRASAARCSRSATGSCLDYVSRPEAFARLYPKLLDGYLLDALEPLDGKPAGGAAGGVPRVARRGAAQPAALRGARRGRATARGDGVVGSGLELDGELVQLCAFSSDGAGEPPTRIMRPSRRR